MSGETLLDNPLSLKANYEALINGVDDLIWSVSNDFRLLTANNAFVEAVKIYTGITVKPGDNLIMRDIFPGDYLLSWEDAYHNAFKGGSFKKELYTPSISNRPESWTEINFNPIYKSGEIIAIACCSRDITEKKFKEELLIKSEARLAELQAVAKLGSWETDLLNYSVIWSAETFRIFELDRSRFKSSHPGFLEFVHPDDRAKVDKAFADSLGSTADNSIEHRIILSNGSIKWVDERWRISRNDQNKPVRAIGTCQDITERKNAEENLRASSVALQNTLNDLNKIMNSSLDAICVVDVNGYFKKVSAACEAVFGYKAEELIGRLIFDFVYPEDRHKTKMSAERVMTGDYTPNFTNRYVRKDGSLVYIEWSASWDANDKMRYGIARDVTYRKIAEAHLTELHESIRRQSEKLLQSNEELERFAYVASHDLQEPLRMVTSFLQLLKKKYDQQLDETAQKYINFAVDGANRMKTLILDLLEFSRISSLAVDHTVIDLTEVVKKTRMVLKSVIDESHAKINVSVLPKVCGNESQLLQLFQNLVSNAIKYRDLSIPEIEITYSETPQQWQFCVHDNGIGIDADYHDKIFIIFQRLHNKKDYSGTGIGLAICKKIVQLHGGNIWVESSKGKGSKFYFTISKFQTSAIDGSKLLCPGLAVDATKNHNEKEDQYIINRRQ
ncbi:PAS domain S-box protein [Ginsengibacter hankyongi]|uniref:histidine kinase n=1 Tax=Ginsengibacter hankyongi TaxID=2607284 RepID=A0A5J5ILT3_9BACT|nr:PAS domain S-box protein [Ginsengibacter hankyongi]KAA9040854.1 PAS domain S-box protein [Ginsengibacter hankyongi]